MDKYGDTARIGDWQNRNTFTRTEDADRFYAILGSPNGAGAGYLLLNHKAKLGIKTIQKVDVFVPKGSFSLVGVDPLGEEAEGAQIMLLFYVTAV